MRGVVSSGCSSCQKTGAVLAHVVVPVLFNGNPLDLLYSAVTFLHDEDAFSGDISTEEMSDELKAIKSISRQIRGITYDFSAVLGYGSSAESSECEVVTPWSADFIQFLIKSPDLQACMVATVIDLADRLALLEDVPIEYGTTPFIKSVLNERRKCRKALNTTAAREISSSTRWTHAPADLEDLAKSYKCLHHITQDNITVMFPAMHLTCEPSGELAKTASTLFSEYGYASDHDHVDSEYDPPNYPDSEYEYGLQNYPDSEYEYGPPSWPDSEYDPPSWPDSEYDPPSWPDSEYDPPSYPDSEYDPPSYPDSEYDPPSYPTPNTASQTTPSPTTNDPDYDPSLPAESEYVPVDHPVSPTATL